MGFARSCLTTPTVRPELVEGLSNSVLLIDFVDLVPPPRLGRIANLLLAGAARGKRPRYAIHGFAILSGCSCPRAKSGPG